MLCHPLHLKKDMFGTYCYLIVSTLSANRIDIDVALLSFH